MEIYLSIMEIYISLEVYISRHLSGLTALRGRNVSQVWCSRRLVAMAAYRGRGCGRGLFGWRSGRCRVGPPVRRAPTRCRWSAGPSPGARSAGPSRRWGWSRYSCYLETGEEERLQQSPTNCRITQRFYNTTPNTSLGIND